MRAQYFVQIDRTVDFVNLCAIGSYSYIVRLGTADYHVHANDLRRYNVRSDEVRYTASAIAAGGDDTVTLEPG